MVFDNFQYPGTSKPSEWLDGLVFASELRRAKRYAYRVLHGARELAEVVEAGADPSNGLRRFDHGLSMLQLAYQVQIPFVQP